MGIARINISLQDDVLEEISRFVEPRKRSKFIAEAITQALERHKARRLALEYQEAAQETRSLNRELEGTIGDGLN